MQSKKSFAFVRASYEPSSEKRQRVSKNRQEKNFEDVNFILDYRFGTHVTHGILYAQYGAVCPALSPSVLTRGMTPFSPTGVA